MYKAVFKRSIAKLPSDYILGISLGSKTSNGEPLKAVVECLNNSTLHRGVIDVSDSLKRFSYRAQGMSEEEAHSLSVAQGREWRQRNDQSLQALKSDTRIIHWDYWLNKDRFDTYREQFTRAANDDPDLSSALETDIQKFHTRTGKSRISRAEFNLSRDFFIEELAVLSIQFEDCAADSQEKQVAQVYPGKQLQCFKTIREGRVTGIPEAIQQTPFYSLNVYQR